jgi:serralysin
MAANGSVLRSTLLSMAVAVPLACGVERQEDSAMPVAAYDPTAVVSGPRLCTLREMDVWAAVGAMHWAERENPLNAPMAGYTPSLYPDTLRMEYPALLHSKRWATGRTLRVRFFNGDSTLRARVFRTAVEWTRHANVRLVESGDRDAEIRIRFTSDGASWSFLGTDAGRVSPNSHTMQFGWLTPTSSDEEVGRVVLHEFGHALGLIHEHQSPAASIPWDTTAVYDYYNRRYGWNRSMVDAQIFRRYSETSTQYSAFDSLSIMQYAVPEELTLGDYAVGWNSTLSGADTAFARTIYP